MVCPRCIMAVEKLFAEQGINVAHIQLGEVVLPEELSHRQLAEVREKLDSLGFELLDDEQSRTVEKIKTVVIESINKQKGEHLVFSKLIAQALGRDYSQLSKLFSTVEGITIERYIILQRIEKVKELLVYNELNLSEIAFETGYSSAAHLSAQFKKTTGMTPSQFKKQGIPMRKPLDSF